MVAGSGARVRGGVMVGPATGTTGLDCASRGQKTGFLVEYCLELLSKAGRGNIGG